MHITPVGFGAWAIGGGDWAVGWGSQDDKQSIAAIRHAVERGVNWIDTAAIYGLGHSEEIVRAALKEIPSAQRPFVFTKCGLRLGRERPHGDRRRTSARPPASAASWKPRSSASASSASTSTRCTGRPRTARRSRSTGKTLLDLKAEGKVRAVGLSNHNVAQLTAAESVGHVDTLQPPFSAIRREFAASELPWCVAHDTGVIVYSPMQAGLLTGAFTAERAKALPADDWRSRNAEFTGDKLKAQPRARRDDEGRRQAPRHERRGGRHRLDARLAGRQRRHRRRARA